jgi:hypothetical protein
MEMPNGSTPDIDQLFRNWDDIAVSELHPCWDLRNLDTELAEKLFEREPGLKLVCQALGSRLPYLRTHRPVTIGPFIRPIGHGRSFYVDIESLIGLDPRGPAMGYLAVKGSEVASDDYAVWMTSLRQRRQFWGFNGGNEFTTFRSSMDTTLNNLERWPLVERKVPGAVTLSEAMVEASIALEFQTKYMRRYGDFARVPLPLFVYRWPESVTERAWFHLRPLLTSRAAEIVEQTLARSLAVYVYYYPALPIRLMSLEGFQPSQTLKRDVVSEADDRAGPTDHHATSARRVSRLMSTGDLIERWSELFVRMLALGYLPKDPGCLLTADCLQPWNVVLDGGFVDIDSIVPIESLDDVDVDDCIRRSLRGLVLIIAYRMLGPVAFSMEFRDRFPEVTWIVLNDVRKRLLHESVNGGIPTKLQALVESNGVYSDLDRLFRRARGGR